jgi:undecaprenyl pyrophosphate synthase
LNICCAYGSREEMTNACKEICEGIKKGVLNIE